MHRLKAIKHPELNRFALFIATRCVGTFLSYAIYLLLLGPIGYRAAFCIAFILGIGLAYLMNASLVFKARISQKTAIEFPLVYVAQFFLGLLIVEISIRYFYVPKEIALAISILITIPVTYALTKIVFRRRSS